MSVGMVTLDVQHIGAHWRLRRERMGQRGRPETETAIRWVRREMHRARASIASDPIVSMPEGCLEHWPMAAACFVVTARIIPAARAYGLPERFPVSADAVEFPHPVQIEADHR